MCGFIAKFSRSRAKPFPVGPLSDMIAHRGPDASGAMGWNEGECPRKIPAEGVIDFQHALVHRRLSIIDLHAHADQPFSSADGRFHLVYNGEIYNYVELREQLRAAGSDFRTYSDTEVLLESWRVWGSDCLSRLEGMFAFVIFDAVRNCAYAARDPFGIKPLFVSKTNEDIIFCSEMWPIAAFREEVSLDRKSVSQCLRWGMNDGHERTIIEGIERVPAGSWVSLEPGKATVSEQRKYFDLRAIKKQDWSFEEAKKTLRDTFVSGVERHMRSDAKLGFALSGGIDSSSIVCVAHALGREDITTFSYVPKDRRLSERDWIDLVVQHVGAKSHIVQPDLDRASSRLRDVAISQGEPFASLSIFAQHEVYALVREEDFKVILSGQGADELLAGYVSYYQFAMANAFRCGDVGTGVARMRLLHERFGQSYGQVLNWAMRLHLPRKIRDQLAKSLLERKAPWINTAAMARTGMNSWAQIDSRRPAAPDVRTMLIDSMQDSLIALLRYDDRNSMAHSVESRVPFLTREMATLCLSFPDEFFIDRNGVTKHIFREAMRGIVPNAVLERPDKIGFAPDNRAWAGALAGFATKSGEDPLDGLVRGDRLNELTAAKGRDGTDFALAWRTLNLLFLEKAYGTSPS